MPLEKGSPTKEKEKEKEKEKKKEKEKEKKTPATGILFPPVSFLFSLVL